MKYYINRLDGSDRETVDEFEQEPGQSVRDFRRYVSKMLDEHRVSDPFAEYYTSKRCCKGWND